MRAIRSPSSLLATRYVTGSRPVAHAAAPDRAGPIASQSGLAALLSTDGKGMYMAVIAVSPRSGVHSLESEIRALWEWAVDQIVAAIAVTGLLARDLSTAQARPSGE
jgi:hypothetical protein